VGGGAQGPISQNCTSHPSNISRYLELSRTLSNPCSQKNELTTLINTKLKKSTPPTQQTPHSQAHPHTHTPSHPFTLACNVSAAHTHTNKHTHTCGHRRCWVSPCQQMPCWWSKTNGSCTVLWGVGERCCRCHWILDVWETGWSLRQPACV